jgi:ferredoxin
MSLIVAHEDRWVGGRREYGEKQLMTPNPLPIIDQEHCDGCAQCVEVCPTQALTLAWGKAELRYPDRCTYCAACEEACPLNAIALPFVIVLKKRMVEEL